MKKLSAGLLLFTPFLCDSCIQDEPLNSECDIEVARVVTDDETLLLTASERQKAVSSASSTILFYLPEDFTDSVKLEAIKLEFDLTPGATISPASGSVQNFRGKDVVYTVTSEDGQWHRNYHVRFTSILPLETDLSFEHFRDEPERGRYEEWFETTDEGHVINQWATGNPGFAISRSSAEKHEFPTIAYTNDAVSGYSVKLETCNTGAFGAMMNMRIAAGNLFIGTFDVANALRDAMAATRFGLPFNERPVRFQGYYKFKPGAEFWNRRGEVQVGRVDQPDLYAVMYRNVDEAGNPFTLQGDNVLTHPNIVALARIENPVHVAAGTEMKDAEWTYFDIPFDYASEPDENVLQNYGYNLAVVFTSSIEGASFCGAVGSTLLVDEVKVVCENKTEE